MCDVMLSVLSRRFHCIDNHVYISIRIHGRICKLIYSIIINTVGNKVLVTCPCMHMYIVTLHLYRHIHTDTHTSNDTCDSHKHMYHIHDIHRHRMAHTTHLHNCAYIHHVCVHTHTYPHLSQSICVITHTHL